MKTSTPTPARIIQIERVTIPRARARALGDFKALADSIRELGLMNPITVTKDLVLIAGLHRLRACKSLAWREIPAVVLDLEPLAAEMAEIDENLIRNDLTVLERGECLKRRKEIYEALHPETRKGGAPGKAGGGKTKTERISSFADDAAKKTKTTPRTVRHEVQIAEGIADDVKEAIRGTDLADSKSDLLDLARIKDPRKQREMAERAREGGTTVRRAVRDAKRQERVERLVEESRTNTPLTGELGSFPIIYADPPWSYDNVPETEERHITEHYSTMSLLEICKLPVPEIATDDAWLFLWATSPLLPYAMRVLNEWDFTYKTSAVWVKDRIGMGYVFRQRHELLLVGVRGNPPTPLPPDRRDSVFEAPRGKHSAKPAMVAEAIEAMFPELPKVELFARAARPGWKRWGFDSPKEPGELEWRTEGENRVASVAGGVYCAEPDRVRGWNALWTPSQGRSKKLAIGLPEEKTAKELCGSHHLERMADETLRAGGSEDLTGSELKGEAEAMKRRRA